MHRTIAAFALLLTCATAPAADAEDSLAEDLDVELEELPTLRHVVLDDLDDPQWGHRWCTTAYQGADPECHLVGEPQRAGGSGVMQVSVDPGGSLTMLLRARGFGDLTPAPKRGARQQYGDCGAVTALPGRPREIGIWVHGQKGGQRLRIEICDDGGKSKWFPFELGVVDFAGWRLLKATIASESGEGPTLTYPWHLGGLTIEGPTVAKVSSELQLDDLTVWTETDEPFVVGAERWSGAAFDRACVAHEPFDLRVWADVTGDSAKQFLVEAWAEPIQGSDPGTGGRSSTRLSLAAGAHGQVRIPLVLPAGVYRLHARIGDGADTREVALDNIPVFPDGSHELSLPPARDLTAMTSGRDLWSISSGCAPGMLAWTNRGSWCFFQGQRPFGLGGPSHLAIPTADGVRVIAAGDAIPVAEMSEPWLLAWYHGASGWDGLTIRGTEAWRGTAAFAADAPMLLTLQRRPTALTMPDAQGGLSATFAGEAGYAVVTPLYGARVPPASMTAAWSRGLPDDIARLCRKHAALAHHFPYEVTETFAIDHAKDEIRVRERVQYVSFADDWGSPAEKVAPLPATMGLAIRAKCPFVSFAPAAPIDLEMPMSVGPWHGIPGVDEYEWTMHGMLPYIDGISRAKRVHLEDPRVKEAYDAIVGNLLGSNRMIWFICGEIGRWADDAGIILPMVPDGDWKRNALRYTRWCATKAVSPANLGFDWNGRSIGATDLMPGYDRDYFTSLDYAVFSAYVLGSRDLDTYRNRRAHHAALQTNMRNSPWDTLGWPGGIAGEGMYDFVRSTIDYARIAALDGDGVTARYATFIGARALLSYYAMGMGAADYVSALAPWPMMEMRFVQVRSTGRWYANSEKGVGIGAAVLEWRDFSYTDSWGGNLGLSPWAPLIMGGTNGAAFHDGITRFWTERMHPYFAYWSDERVKKFMPEAHQALFVDRRLPEMSAVDQRTGKPIWRMERIEVPGSREGQMALVGGLDANDFRLRLDQWLFGWDVDASYRLWRAFVARPTHLGRDDHVFGVLNAGIDWEIERLPQHPHLVDGVPGFELGNQRENGAGGACRTMWESSVGQGWPQLVYYNYATTTPPPSGDTGYGVLPAMGEVRPGADAVIGAQEMIGTWNGRIWMANLK